MSRLVRPFVSVQSGGRFNHPSLSIALMLEADRYPGINQLLRSSNISHYLRQHPGKHLTLSTLVVPIKDLLDQLKPLARAIKYHPRQTKLARHQLDLLVDLVDCYVNRQTTKFVLSRIKPLIDRHQSVNLPFLGLELWPAGHFVAVFDQQDQVINQIIGRVRRFLLELFPTGSFRQTQIIPHLTLGKYDPENHRIHRKLQQPVAGCIPDYKLIKKQWIIYPSVRYRY